MKKIFARRLCIVMILALIAIIGVNYAITDVRARDEMLNHSNYTINLIETIINNNETEIKSVDTSIMEDYLVRCKALNTVINNNPSIVKSPQKLAKIKEDMSADLIDVVDSKGIIRYSTSYKHVGYNLKNSVQTRKFLEIIKDGKKEIVQQVVESGIDKKSLQFVGVAREDQTGIVIMGFSPEKYLKIKQDKELSYVFEQMPVDAGNFYFVIDTNTDEILAHTKSQFVGKDGIQLGLSVNYKNYFDQVKTYKIFGEKCYIVMSSYNDIAIGVGKTIQSEKDSFVLTNVYLFIYLFGVFLIVIFVLTVLLEKNIINGIHKIIDRFNSINEGDLDTQLEVNDNPEFAALSGSINTMVNQLKSKVDRDNLTGLYCRRKFEEIVTTKLNEEPGMVSIIMLDLDNFKGVNDNYGHHFGDMYLQKIARCLTKITHDNCYFGRRSGDEFYIFIYNLKSRIEVRDLLEDFYKILEENKMTFPDGTTRTIKISAGVYCTSNNKEAYAEMLAKADKKLYEAKRNNKGSYLM